MSSLKQSVDWKQFRSTKLIYFFCSLLICTQVFFLQSCATSSIKDFENGAKFKEDTQELGVAPITFVKKNFVKGTRVEKINAGELLVPGGFLDDLRKTNDPEIRAQKIKSMIVNVARIKFDGEEGAIKVKRQLFDKLGFKWDESFLMHLMKNYQTMNVPMNKNEDNLLIYDMYQDTFSIMSHGGAGDAKNLIIEYADLINFIEANLPKVKCGKPRPVAYFRMRRNAIYCSRMGADNRYSFDFQYTRPAYGEHRVKKINFYFFEG